MWQVIRVCLRLHSCMFAFAKKRVDILEKSEEQRDKPVGDIIKSAPVVFGLVQKNPKGYGETAKGYQRYT